METYYSSISGTVFQTIIAHNINPPELSGLDVYKILKAGEALSLACTAVGADPAGTSLLLFNLIM